MATELLAWLQSQVAEWIAYHDEPPTDGQPQRMPGGGAWADGLEWGGGDGDGRVSHVTYHLA